MAAPEVKNFDKLLHDYLGNNSEIIEHKTKYLTAPGDNYGSLMLSLDLSIKRNGSAEKLHTVVKCVPATEHLRNIFQVQTTVKKELLLYRDAVPALINFQKENGILEDKLLNAFPKFYGGRLNLNQSDVVDEDAAIVLENLKTLGYDTGNRVIGLSLEDSKVALRNLAQVHAVSIALKILKPEVFKSKVLPSLFPTVFGNEQFDTELKNYSVELKKYFDKINEFKPYTEKAAELIKNSARFPQNFVKPKEPLATLVHQDFHVNNMLFLWENGKAIKHKMVDFQVSLYASPLQDFIFFFFTSIRDSVIQNNYNELFDFYYNNFIECLKEFKLNVSEFSKSAFEKELKEIAEFEFGHIMMILWGIFADKAKLKNADLNSCMFAIDMLDPAFYPRADYMFREYIKRGWFN